MAYSMCVIEHVIGGGVFQGSNEVYAESRSGSGTYV